MAWHWSRLRRVNGTRVDLERPTSPTLRQPGNIHHLQWPHWEPIAYMNNYIIPTSDYNSIVYNVKCSFDGRGSLLFSLHLYTRVKPIFSICGTDGIAISLTDGVCNSKQWQGGATVCREERDGPVCVRVLFYCEIFDEKAVWLGGVSSRYYWKKA